MKKWIEKCNKKKVATNSRRRSKNKCSSRYKWLFESYKSSSLSSTLTKGLTSFNDFSKNLVTGLATVGTAVATTGAGVTTLAANIGMVFDTQMSTVQALSGATATEVDALTIKAKELGSSTSFSATEVAQGFEYMALAGWDTQSMISGIDGALNATAASGENLATVSNILTDGLTAFGEGADQAGRMADILAVASSSSNTTIGMLGETFKYVAPVAGTLGYSMEDVAVASGLMANAYTAIME